MTKQKTFWSGDKSNAAIEITTVAKTNKEWKSLWGNLLNDNFPGDLPENVMAVAIFTGEMTKEGTVKIDSTELDGNTLTVKWSREENGNDARRHSPYVILFIGKTDSKVVFEKINTPKGPRTKPRYSAKQIFKRFFK